MIEQLEARNSMVNQALRQNFQKKLVDYFFRSKIIVGAALLACSFFFHYFRFFGLESIPTIITLLVEMFIFSFYYFVRSTRPEWVLHYNLASLWIDILAVTVALHYLGGIYSMMWPLPYLLLIAIASLFLSRKGRVMFSAYVLLCYSSLFQLEHQGFLSRHNVFGVPQSSGLDVFCWASMAFLILIMALVSYNFVELLGRFQAFASLGRFSTELAHEIRTPLQAIENLIHREDLPPSVSAEVLGQTERMSRFVKEMLAFGREERQRISRIRIQDLVGYSVDLVSKALPSPCGIELERQFCEEDLWVDGDMEQLTKALSNLMRNGIDSMNGRGRLVVSVSRFGFEWLQVEIQDTGTGILKSEIPKIFEPFYTTKAGRRGIGLGLAIAKKFVEAHSGRIEVESRPGLGSKFTVKLPLAEC
ncbi:MAG: ATP-binding protein [bacterium]